MTAQTIPQSTKDGTNINIPLKPTFDDLKSHVNDLTKTRPAEKNILDQLLNQLHEISFSSEEGENVSIKKMVVLTIDEILEVATRNRWGLSKKGGFVYVFNGCYWETIEREQFQMFLGQAAIRLGITSLTARHYEFKEKLMKQFEATAVLPAPDPTSKVSINLLNGTFDFDPENGNKLRPFDPKDFHKYQLKFDFDPEAKAPKFQKFLDRVLPDQQAQKVLAEYMGYVFVKNSTLKLEKTLILYGSGSNGKSVVFDILTGLLGQENYSVYSLQSLTNEVGNYRAHLQNKLLNYASEINVRMETSYFKALTSGDPVEARLLYGQAFDIKDYARLIFNANQLPADVEQTHAFYRRFLILPFMVTIPSEEQDKNLAKSIVKDELSGIFNFILEGLERLLKQKNFSACDLADKALAEYRTQSDSVRFFLQEENYNYDPDCTTPVKELYSEYRIFCDNEGFRPVSKVNFKKRLAAAGIETKRDASGNVALIKKQSNDPF